MPAYTFADPAPLPDPDTSGNYVTDYVSNAALVMDPDEPDAAGLFRPAWFSFTPGVDGQLTAVSSSSQVLAYVAVYTGTSLTDAVLASDPGEQQSVTVAVVAGTTYHLRVSAGEDTVGNYLLFGTAPSTAVTPPPPDNDTLATAETVTITGAPYVSAPVSDAAGTLEPGEVAGEGYRSVWWDYTPGSSGTATIDTSLSDDFDTLLHVYTGTVIGDLSLVGTDDDSGDGSRSQLTALPVSAGVTYHIRVSSFFDVPHGNFVLRVSGPNTGAAGPQPVPAVPADTVVELLIPGLGAVTVEAPPADILIDGSGSTVKVVAAVPIEALIGPRGTDSTRVRRVLGRPSPDTVVPVDRPQLTVGVQVLEGDVGVIDVQIQYAAGQLTDASPILTDTVTGDVRVTLATVHTPPLSNGAYTWRARLVIDGTPQSWTPGRAFTVDDSASDATCPVTWTVTAAGTTPHLWSVDPPAGTPGDRVTLHGQGLPTTPTVTLGGVQAPVISAVHVPGTPAALGPARTLDDVEHDEIVITVPAVDAPGGPLIVRGSY